MPAGEVTTGIRSVLSRPDAYEFVQRAVGADAALRRFVTEFVRPPAGSRVLDIGCGTATMLQFVTDVRYVGLDINPRYVARARSRFADRDAEFHVADATAITPDLGQFDVVVITGVLHHLDDTQASAALHGSATVLQPNGRLVALEPTVISGQHWFARALIKRDRGQHIRSPAAYRALAGAAFADVEVIVLDDLLRVPYTHCVLRCRAPSAA